MRRVAAAPGHDIDDQAAGFDLAQRVGPRDRHFCRVADVGTVAGRRVAGRRTPDVQPVQRQPPLVRPSAVDRERGGRRGRDRVVRCSRDTRHERHQRVVAASGGNRGDDLGWQRRLASHVMRIDGRKKAGDRDRVAESPRHERRVDDGGERSCELDAFALRRLPARQREAH